MSRSGSNKGSSNRIYIGHLPSRVGERDLEELCRRYGRIRDISTKNGFGFVVSDVTVAR